MKLELINSVQQEIVMVYYFATVYHMMVSSSATLNNYSLLPITYPTGNIAQVYG
jgi:hypothetical protein